MTNQELVTEITFLLSDAVIEPDATRALGKVEAAKKLMQDLYYNLWLVYHQSGTHK